MQTPLAGALQFTPFANISVPSSTMVGYAGFYPIVVLAAAIYHFQYRDLQNRTPCFSRCTKTSVTNY
jgi:hypothetical protein